MSRWWRAKDNAVDDPKLCLITDRAHRAWFNLCCLASANGGALPDMKVIALKLRLSAKRLETTLAELRNARLLDADGTSMRPHNWDQHQFKSDVSTDRVEEFRERKRNAGSNVDETFQQRPQRQSTETESPSLRSGRACEGWPPDAFDRFWQTYPHRVGKKAAAKAFAVAARSGVTVEQLMLGLERYIAEKPADRAWCNPATWLAQGRWDDQPAPVQTGPPGRAPYRNGGGILDVTNALQQRASADDHDSTHDPELPGIAPPGA